MVMERLEILILIFGVFLVTTAFSSGPGVSVSCMMAYDEGGAPAVFESQECTNWLLSVQNQTLNCDYATLQGHRKYQEDRMACDLDMKISFIGKTGPEEVRVGVVALFDGHGGKEAAEMASKLLLDYIRLHSVFIMYKEMITQKGNPIIVLQSSGAVLPKTGEGPMHLQILKDALVKAMRDIDSVFTQEALQRQLYSGSTAVIVMMVDEKILVANIGDSKALLCSTGIQSGNTTLHVLATELTNDHHPDRDDEKARIEAAGGSVIMWGVPRVNGMLAMSRSIGDVYLKRYGVISVPELTGWKSLNGLDEYLVVASDGIFESLAPQDVCDLITSSCSSLVSSAECIVATAYEKGSMDNLSAMVVPQTAAGTSRKCKQDITTKF